MGKVLKFYTAQIVRNSKWVKELETINKVHSLYNPKEWRLLNRYIFWFHDNTFECIAKSYNIEVFQKSMDEVFGEAANEFSLNQTVPNTACTGRAIAPKVSAQFAKFRAIELEVLFVRPAGNANR